uniref:F-box domain-containing protein n=2 Tax=Triticum urartu TaxID=4572 RepID=A0A8R7RAX5_TRIUA
MSSARSPSAAPELLDDDDLLPEILLRLPPQPSSLPRASLVSKRWRSVASESAFSRRFRRHHRLNPPLLGFFRVELRGRFEPRFEPSLDAPNRIPPERLSWRWNKGDDCYDLLGCRHGLVLVLNRAHTQVLVWDPVTGDRRRVAVPP